jgi:hypothetical protein
MPIRLQHLALALVMTQCVHGQSRGPDPQVGYVYPSGACRNSTVEILAGGQNIRNTNSVRVTGQGVQARVIKTYRAVRNLDQDQRALMQWRIACRRAQLAGKPVPPEPKPTAPTPDGKPVASITLPDIPFIDRLETLDEPGITSELTVFQRHDRQQPSPQLGEMVRIEVKVAADAEPGVRELRLAGPQGLSNPLRFEIGTLPEVAECEPNEPTRPTAAKLPPAPRAPCTFNGQIQSGDVDVFRFHANRGANLVVRGRARAVIPYLADAVPGWFQMVVKVSDANGRELAFADDFRFDPDPVFCFRIPDDGDYTLEIRDAIFRGREDFVYRVHVGNLPFVTSVFPLGGTAGQPLAAATRGWNLPFSNITLDTSPGGPTIRSMAVQANTPGANEIRYAVDTLPAVTVSEPDNDNAKAQPCTLPGVINGRIDTPGDVDVIRIDARKGQEFVAEVLARRLRSPLDAVIHARDAAGKVLAWNDDTMEKDGTLHLGDGLLTHHADPIIRVLPLADGPVFLRVADTQAHGGPEFAYRLLVRQLQPDFDLRVTPSVLNVPAGGHVALEVQVLRLDGFTGEISLALENAPPGFVLAGARIPAGANKIRLTLGVPPGCQPGVLTPRLVGRANAGGRMIHHDAVAADDAMQAFLWRHLVPAESWLVAVAAGRGRRTPLELAASLPVRIPAGGSAELVAKVPKWMLTRELEARLNDAPPGISLPSFRTVPGGMAIVLKADASLKPGMETNLIIDCTGSNGGDNKPGAPAKPKTRSSIASLPAIPILIVPPPNP